VCSLTAASFGGEQLLLQVTSVLLCLDRRRRFSAAVSSAGSYHLAVLWQETGMYMYPIYPIKQRT
jgi:hypothetical protein